MPYVPGFTNDIFISFSHVDNWDGWVEEFQKHLRNRLLQIGADVTVWRDSKLRGPDVFSEEIFTQLKQSALLVSIISPAGIKSRWCEDERQVFERFAALNGGIRVDNYLRTIKVVKTPLPGDQHRELFGVLGYEFYEREPATDRFREFDDSSPEFRRIVDNLAQDIKSLLDAFCRHLDAAFRRDTVYVATTTPDLKRSRDAIVQQLEDWGYAVIPRDPEPPSRFASFQAAVKAELAEIVFSVHLVSDQPQPVLEGGQDSITEQYEIAQSLRKDRILWIEPGRRLYSQFEDALNNGLQKGVEILQNCSIEDLKDVIEEKLNRLRRPPQIFFTSEAEVEFDTTPTDHPSLENSHGHEETIVAKEPAVDIVTLDPRWAPRRRFVIEDYRTLYEGALNATTNAEKGTALEDLAEYMFLCVPGLETRFRNLRTDAEEIDLAFSNQGDGFWRDIGSPFIVECRNLISPVSAKMIRDFLGKMRTKAMRTGFVITTSYVTKDGVIEQRQALREGTTVVSVEGKDLLRIATEGNLLRVFEDRYFHCRLL